MSDTPLPGWPYAESPFHDGERAIQRRLGIDAKLEAVGRKVIRNLMPEQHRQFFEQLPLLLVGSVDSDGQPWASVLAGRPGFVHSPSPQQLDVDAVPLQADPLQRTLSEGAALGVLGIEPHTRRRNRMNGTVIARSGRGFSLRVNRSFGNCPKYIQAREPVLTGDIDRPAAGKEVIRGATLDPAMQAIIRAADTFFIAAAVDDEAGNDAPPHGADVSHRGGKPGFVRIDGDATLTVPDFIGNFFFNTLGNIVANPRAGLLFIDFASGDLLYLATQAEIVWDGPEVEAFAGAQRLMRFTVRQAVLVKQSLPLRWGPATPSPVLDATGSWENGNKDLPAP